MSDIHELAIVLSDAYRRSPWGNDAFEDQAKAAILAGWVKREEA